MNNGLNFQESRTAIVTDVLDPERRGRVKVRIMPELYDTPVEQLPWVEFYSPGIGIGADSSAHIVPSLGTYVKVIIEDPQWNNIKWTHGDYIPGREGYRFVHELNVKELSPQTYPQPNMQRTADGTIIFHNTETGEIGIVKQDGTYFLMGLQGQVVVKSGDSRMQVFPDKIAVNTPKIEIQGLERMDEEFVEKVVSFSKISETGGTKTEQYDSLTTTVLGLTKLRYGGELKTSVAGNKAETVLGNSTTTATGKVQISSPGATIELDPLGGISLKTGDSILWQPNILPACIFSGVPHGGLAAGITRLKGGI